MRASKIVMCLLLAVSVAEAKELTHVCNYRPSDKVVVIPMPNINAIHVSGPVTFSVVFEEPDGAFSAWNDRVEQIVLAAAAEWAGFLDGNVNIELEIRFRDNAAIGGALASAGSGFYFFEGEETGWSGTILEMFFGFDPNGTEFDGLITINSDVLSDFSFDLSGAVPGQTDLYSVVLHELGHVLGFDGNFDGFFGGDWESTFDLNVLFDGGLARFFFIGTAATANFGSRVWLASTPHVGDEIPSLMNTSIGTNIRLSVGKLELAMLSDSEMPFNLFCWSSPSLIEADFDGDGTPDCIDECPANPLLALPGVCGCDTTDRDGDGTVDCLDGCPDNPLLASPGVCGCSTEDRDGDGVMDCIDECPDNPLLVSPGVCGCDATDTDGDGVLDCIDECPDNPVLTVEGVCGCRTDDFDNDGVLDCLDQCFADPLKVTKGICGCGIPDTDTDGDGTPDCVDDCPTDPDKTVPGECGCGVLEGTCAPSLCGAGVPVAMAMAFAMLALCVVRRRF